MLAYTPAYPAASRLKDVFLADRATEFLIYNFCDLFANGHYSLAVEHFIKENKLDMDFLESDREILSKMIRESNIIVITSSDKRRNV